MPVSVWEKLGLSIECLVDVMTLERMKWEHEVKMRCLRLWVEKILQHFVNKDDMDI